MGTLPVLTDPGPVEEPAAVAPEETDAADAAGADEPVAEAELPLTR